MPILPITSMSYLPSSFCSCNTNSKQYASREEYEELNGSQGNSIMLAQELEDYWIDTLP